MYRSYLDTGNRTSEDIFYLLAIRGPTRGEGKRGIEPGSSDPKSSPLPLRHRGGPQILFFLKKKCTIGSIQIWSLLASSNFYLRWYGSTSHYCRALLTDISDTCTLSLDHVTVTWLTHIFYRFSQVFQDAIFESHSLHSRGHSLLVACVVIHALNAYSNEIHTF